MLRIELLDRSHNRKTFDCGSADLNRFLRKTARQHITKGMSRTFVLVDTDSADTILGFYTLSVCEVETDNLHGDILKKYPDRVPAVKLARLAVGIDHQSTGLGGLLLADAVQKVSIIGKNVGIIGLFVDAKDRHAAAFYKHFGFIPLRDDPPLLFLPAQTLLNQ